MKRRQQRFVRPETIERLAQITGSEPIRLRLRLTADPDLTVAEPPVDEDTVVVGSMRPVLGGSRREVCGRCGGPCWLADSPLPGAAFLCVRCYVRDEAPEMAWMLGPQVH